MNERFRQSGKKKSTVQAGHVVCHRPDSQPTLHTSLEHSDILPIHIPFQSDLAAIHLSFLVLLV